MTRKPPSINFHFESSSWNEQETEYMSTHVLGKAAQVLNRDFSGEEMSIVFADDAFIADLNHRFRGKDGPTNVLSFPDDEDDYLGDVILAYETIQTEADQQNKSFDHHFQHIILHGFLHLLGYDHQTDQEAEEMETLEIKVLQAIGIENPYEERKIC